MKVEIKLNDSSSYYGQTIFNEHIICNGVCTLMHAETRIVRLIWGSYCRLSYIHTNSSRFTNFLMQLKSGDDGCRIKHMWICSGIEYLPRHFSVRLINLLVRNTMAA